MMSWTRPRALTTCAHCAKPPARPLEFQALNSRLPEILGTYRLNRQGRKLRETDGLNRDAGKLRGWWTDTEKLNRAPGKLRGIAALGESRALLFLLHSPKFFLPVAGTN